MSSDLQAIPEHETKTYEIALAVADLLRQKQQEPFEKKLLKWIPAIVVLTGAAIGWGQHTQRLNSIEERQNVSDARIADIEKNYVKREEHQRVWAEEAEFRHDVRAWMMRNDGAERSRP